MSHKLPPRVKNVDAAQCQACVCVCVCVCVWLCVCVWKQRGEVVSSFEDSRTHLGFMRHTCPPSYPKVMKTYDREGSNTHLLKHTYADTRTPHTHTPTHTHTHTHTPAYSHTHTREGKLVLDRQTHTYTHTYTH